MPLTTMTSVYELSIEIGEVAVLLRTDSPQFARMLEDRYGGFVNCESAPAGLELQIDLIPAGRVSDAEEMSVRRAAGCWVMERGDFHAEWNPDSNRGWARLSMNPYAIDGVLRILHSLILARAGGFLLHAASAVRNARAFVFAGISGTGKTTLVRLAPSDVVLLTDEVSFVRPVVGAGSRVAGKDFESLEPGCRDHAFQACGTPFAGELARIGQKIEAPLAGMFLLQQGVENRIEPVSHGQATRELLRHILFFAQDQELVHAIFRTVCDFVRRVPVRRLIFTPEARVWELIQ